MRYVLRACRYRPSGFSCTLRSPQCVIAAGCPRGSTIVRRRECTNAAVAAGMDRDKGSEPRSKQLGSFLSNSANFSSGRGCRPTLLSNIPTPRLDAEKSRSKMSRVDHHRHPLSGHDAAGVHETPMSVQLLYGRKYSFTAPTIARVGNARLGAPREQALAHGAGADRCRALETLP